MSCKFCENFNFASVSPIVENISEDAIHAYLATLGGSKGYPVSSQFKYCPVCGTKNPNIKEYLITMEVWGTYTVSVEASTLEEAEELAENEWSEADFGELYNINAKRTSVECYNDNILECSHYY